MKRALAWMLVCLALAPAAAYAQATISGVVKDTSGAVLPGVTVEVASPALIEKVRTTVTDGSGAYQIIQLLPGTYTATFTLPGFSTTKRDGIELSGSFVATVNAELRVGELAETITVSGQTPLVDVRSSNVQKVVTKEVVDSVPTGRLGINLAALQPGMILGAGGGVGQANTNALNSQDVGGTAGDTFTDLSIHGGKPAEQRQTIGGVSAATTIRFGESLSSSPSFTAMQEMSVNTSGADASMAAGGVQINYVPRDGGNTFKGLLFFSGANSAMQGDQLLQRHAGRDGRLHAGRQPVLPRPGHAARSVEERLRRQPGLWRADPQGQALVLRHCALDGKRELRAEQLPEPNFVVGPDQPDAAEHHHARAYAPDTSQDSADHARRRRPVLGADRCASATRGFEEQVRHLLQQQEADEPERRQQHGAGVAATRYFFPFSDQLVQWSAPQTNRLLLEAGFWRHQETWGGKRAANDIIDPLAVGITDTNPQTTTGYVQLIQNYHGRVGSTDTASHNPNYRATSTCPT